MTGRSVPMLTGAHIETVWKDRWGTFWRWFHDGERQGWQYESGDRWRFGAMHLYRCAPFDEVGPRELYGDD